MTVAVNLHTNTRYITMKKTCFFVNLLLILSFSAASQLHTDSSLIKRKTLNNSIKYVSFRLPSNFCTLNPGFFCRKDLQVQNAIKMPLHFRLGSVAYCDALEGKNNSHP
jgi:hypothetical protein